MSDLLIRDVADAVVAEIDRRAQEQGLSRAELLRRRLSTEYQPTTADSVSDDDWQRFDRATEDLSDPEVMSGAWT